VKLGAPGIKDVIGMLRAQREGDDAQARFALNGVAWYVNRPGAEGERQLVTRTLIGALRGDAKPEIKTFLISLIQAAGRDESVGPLAGLLGDEDRRRSIAVAVRRLAEERYSWDDIARRLAAIHECVCSRAAVAA